MFKVDALFRIADQHQQTLADLAAVQEKLEGEFYGLEDVITALVLAVATGEPLLLIGAPGTAKSKIIRRFCVLVGISTKERVLGYFEYLLTPFTEPPELWGYLNAKEYSEGRLARINEDRMMQNAKVVFLDEFFKGSSAILNTLLPFMNERLFYDRGEPKKVALQSLFAATNELPDSAELQAVADRFPLRCRVRNVEAVSDRFEDLLKKAWPLTYGPESDAALAPTLLERLEHLRTAIRAERNLFAPDRLHLGIVAQIVDTARDQGLSHFSNRRLIKSTFVMLMHRLYDISRGNERPGPATRPLRAAELKLLPRYFLDDTTNEDAVAQMDDAIEDWAR